MNKYLTRLARDLSNISSDEYEKCKIEVYNESTEEKEMIDYVLYIPIPFDLVPVAEKALNNDADGMYYWDVCYSSDKDEVYIYILGDMDIEEISDEVYVDTRKELKQFLKDYAEKYKNDPNNKFDF